MRAYTFTALIALIAAAAFGIFLFVNWPFPSAQAIPDTGASTTTPATSTPIGQNPSSEPEPEPDPEPTPTPTVLPEIVWGDRTKQQVIFTFDGGAGNHSIDEILEALDKHDVRGTFFLTGKWAEQNGESMRRISADGHEVFNHTYSHRDLTTLTDAEIKEEFAKTEAIIKRFTGKTTLPYFRPPYGARNSRVLAAAAASGYRSIYWTIDALDWKPGISDAEVRARVLDNLKPGTIYMMHIGDDITGRLLDELFTEIKSRGYSIRPLTQGL